MRHVAPSCGRVALLHRNIKKTKIVQHQKKCSFFLIICLKLILFVCLSVLIYLISYFFNVYVHACLDSQCSGPESQITKDHVDV